MRIGLQYLAGQTTVSSVSLTTAVVEHSQIPIHWAPRALSLGIKRTEREAEQSSASGAEISNA